MPPRKRAPRKPDCKLVCCQTPAAAVEKIREDLAGWEAGRWASEIEYGPSCTCTLAAAKEACILHATGIRRDSPGEGGAAAG